MPSDRTSKHLDPAFAALVQLLTEVRFRTTRPATTEVPAKRSTPVPTREGNA